VLLCQEKQLSHLKQSNFKTADIFVDSVHYINDAFESFMTLHFADDEINQETLFEVYDTSNTTRRSP